MKIKEIIIFIYLMIFKIIYSFFSLLPLQQKTTFIVSFNENMTSIIKEHERLLDNQQMIILKTDNCTEEFLLQDTKELNFKPTNLIQFIMSIYHIATSSHIILDNYQAFLSAITFRETVTCTQIWHAAGAVKKFGLEDKMNKTRSDRAVKRFKKVYNQFDYIVVGSTSMANIFKSSFGVEEDKMIYTGIPRTDFFYDKNKIVRARREIASKFPIIKNRKVILYAPTYREGELNSIKLQLDLKEMYKRLSDNYVLFLRLHPAISSEIENNYPDFIIDVSKYESINELLVNADLLVTDYSSIPFEYAILNKPMIFYLYDFEEYDEKKGLNKEVVNNLPGPITYRTDEIIRIIEEQSFQTSSLQSFNKEWNKYSQGNSSNQLISFLYNVSSSSQNRIKDLGGEI